MLWYAYSARGGWGGRRHDRSRLLFGEIVQRPKRGFLRPFDLWMRGALWQFCEERLSRERLGARGLFQPDQVQELWQAFLAGRREVSWSRLWVLVLLEEVYST